jgi:hypothetical protein
MIRSALAPLRASFREDPVEHAHAAPAHETVVDRRVRAVACGRVAPAQPVLDDEDDRAHDPPIVDPRDPVRQWEIGFDPAHLRRGEPKQIGHREKLLRHRDESAIHPRGKQI